MIHRKILHLTTQPLTALCKDCLEIDDWSIASLAEGAPGGRDAWVDITDLSLDLIGSNEQI